MDEKCFWDIIANAVPPGGDVEGHHEDLIELLSQCEPDEIISFGRRFDQLTQAAYTVDLWGAAYLINGGASDDGFYYFRCWLVGMGKKVYENALANPDTLADILPLEAHLDAEAEIYAADRHAWERKGLSEASFEKAAGADIPATSQGLQGEDWDFDDDDEVRRRFPRLAAIYLDEIDP